MGFNSVVLINNDCISDVERDPKSWWSRAWGALSNLQGPAMTYEEAKKAIAEMGEKPWASVNDLTGRFGNFQAVWNRHADEVGLILVGWNRAQVVLHSFHAPVRGQSGPHSEEAQVKFLKQWADKLGYRVSKKPKPRNSKAE
tara:strand:+ start:1283 stop:1708 length:426 start_codon:yes stop_codon:yes gene_type:complete